MYVPSKQKPPSKIQRDAKKRAKYLEKFKNRNLHSFKERIMGVYDSLKLKEIIAKIPPDALDSANLFSEVDEGYDDKDFYVELTYDKSSAQIEKELDEFIKKEQEAEKKIREDNKKVRKTKEEKEFAEYQKLKAKFENK